MWNSRKRDRTVGYLLLVLSLVLLGTADSTAAEQEKAKTAALRWQVKPISKQLERDWQLAPFYKKHISIDGFPILASERVSDYALLEAAYLIERMLDKRPDLLRALVQNKTRFVVMGVKELTTQVPEHSDLQPSRFWDRRARGLGATPERPAVSCGEENLLALPGDPYFTENILIHEFAHAIHHMALDRVDPSFDGRLEAVYEAAMKKGLWKTKYASSNHAEYWAEGVQSWFDTNRPPDHDHNHVDTRAELKKYDPGLAKMVAEIFGDRPWKYRHPTKRKDEPHLQGLDRNKLGRFAWSAELDRWYKQNFPDGKLPDRKRKE